jgi:hypothetical protein
MNFERKTLRKIFGPVIQDIRWRIRTNVELEKLYKDFNTGNCIKLQRHGWIGWMMQGTPRKYTKPIYNKKRPKGRPKATWKDDAGMIQEIWILLTGDK